MDPIINFRKDLEKLINRHSLENVSNTPDFMLAEYLTDCLRTFDQYINRRETWYGRDIFKPVFQEIKENK